MKKKRLIVIISVTCALAVLVSAFFVFRHIRDNQYYSTVPKKLVGTYADFTFKGEHLPKTSMTAGVNINGLEGDWSTPLARNYITDLKTYMNIKKQGFDHIRLPVNFNFYYSVETKSLDDEKMKLIDTVLDLAQKAGLYVQLDFHGWWEFNLYNSAHRDDFLTIWERVAERYSGRSNLLVFELINEPPIKSVPVDRLNALQKEAVERIRKTNPNRLIICAAPDGNQPWLLSELELPEDDNIAVAVHIYHPADFTHQGFEWANPPREKNKRVRLTDAMMDELEWNLNETEKFIKNTGHTVYLNEFGLNLALAHPQDRATYIRRITEWCADNEVVWTFWGYNNQEMALFYNKEWRNDVLDDLFLR